MAAQPYSGRTAGRAVIVDDIITTGTTVREATRALTEAGWHVSCAAVIAATPRGSAASASPSG
jgi:predicted amidophosphoribosyltransferase